MLRDGVDSVTARPDDLARELQPTQRLEPACDHIACGRFVRDGQLILLLVNVGQAQYAGQLQVGKAGSWVVLDPATGSASAATADTAGNLPVHL
ncbi:MAG: hypothetical protein MUF48_22045, partial [Pirellulaceae bacterium]|nr:hypothetical protein [Pirellulaceae bacterium]